MSLWPLHVFEVHVLVIHFRGLLWRGCKILLIIICALEVLYKSHLLSSSTTVRDAMHQKKSLSMRNKYPNSIRYLRNIFRHPFVEDPWCGCSNMVGILEFNNNLLRKTWLDGNNRVAVSNMAYRTKAVLYHLKQAPSSSSCAITVPDNCVR